jgi:hypothetical protein
MKRHHRVRKMRPLRADSTRSRKARIRTLQFQLARELKAAA